MPKEVREQIVCIQRDFLWGWRHDHRKIAWVKLDIICKSKLEGGLGIIELKTLNKALLGN